MKSTLRERKAMGKRFFKLRRKLCLSQEAFGILIGRARIVITKIENGRTYPQYTTLQRFSSLESKHSVTTEKRGVSRELSSKGNP